MSLALASRPGVLCPTPAGRFPPWHLSWYHSAAAHWPLPCSSFLPQGLCSCRFYCTEHSSHCRCLPGSGTPSFQCAASVGLPCLPRTPSLLCVSGALDGAHSSEVCRCLSCLLARSPASREQAPSPSRGGVSRCWGLLPLSVSSRPCPQGTARLGLGAVLHQQTHCTLQHCPGLTRARCQPHTLPTNLGLHTRGLSAACGSPGPW